MKILTYCSLLCLFVLACSNQMNADDQTPSDDIVNDEEPIIDSLLVEVENVAIIGSENSYNFSVTLKSPDTGCDQYADWWEVFDEDYNLIYRRILGHSHVDEQPFTRSGGPVGISADQVVYVRGHMNNLGYGVKVMKGSVSNGFAELVLEVNSGSELTKAEPLPGDCAF